MPVTSMHFFQVAIPLVASWLCLVSALEYRGADFTSLLLQESANIRYTTPSNHNPQPFEHILHDHGVNIARISLWTKKPFDLDNALKLAKRVTAAHMDILLNIFYSDTWCNPGIQAMPSGWPADLEELVRKVYDYTYKVLKTFNDQGTPIQFCQLGNEINDGLLWPTGRISRHGYNLASRILRAAANAVHKASPSTKIVIHLSSAWDWENTHWFYLGIFKEVENGLGLRESDVDVFGFSFYPYWSPHATFQNLNTSMHRIVSAYNKDIMVVETDFPEVCDTHKTSFSVPIPPGIEGQFAWIDGILTVFNGVNQVYGDKAKGIFYFEPGWVQNPSQGSHCADNLLVTKDAVTRKSIDIFRHM